MAEPSKGDVRRHFNYSNVMSTLSVFLVIAGGTALAATAPKNSVKSKSVKNNSLQGKDIRDDSLTGADVDETQLNIPQQAIPSSLSPSGPAGGSLAGEYPNPTLGNNVVGTDQITDGAVGTADLADNSVNSAKIGDGTVNGADVLNGGLNNADVASYTTEANVNWGPINAFSCVNTPIAVPGAGDTSNDLVIANVDSDDLTLGANVAGGATGEQALQVAAQGSTVDNQILLVVCNNTDAAVNPDADVYQFSGFQR